MPPYLELPPVVRIFTHRVRKIQRYFANILVIDVSTEASLEIRFISTVYLSTAARPFVDAQLQVLFRIEETEDVFMVLCLKNAVFSCQPDQ